MTMKGKKCWNCRVWLGVLSLVLGLFLGLTADTFSIVGHAQSQGKITATSAKIRKEPSASSQSLGSAMQGDSVTINHQTKASDGHVWYQVFVNAETLGYIRSDLVSITDGSTPNTVENSAAGTGSTASESTPAPDSTTTVTIQEQEGVTEVEPVSASVTGGNRVRVRSLASTDSQIVTTIENGSALTVNGQLTGADGNVWYRVDFIANGASVAGYIRSDFVELSGELVPKTEVVPEEIIPEEPIVEEQPVITKDWETQLQGDSWYLLDMVSSEQYNIEDLFAAVEQNKAAYEDSQKNVKSQKVVIVILVILLVVLGAGAAFLVLKIRDMMDSAYFSKVEKETLRRREPGNDGETVRDRSGQRVMHTVGAERKPAGGQGARPAGTRPAGSQLQAQAPQGSRPAGARPQGQSPQGGRLAGARPQGQSPQGSRPAGARPQAQSPQGSRPAGGQPQSPRPQGDRLAEVQSQPQEGRPIGSQPQAAKAEGIEITGHQIPDGGIIRETKMPEAQPQGWKSKNFLADDDEFEFEFLNWDGEEE